MKNHLAVSLILLLSAYPAMANWGSFVSMGSITVNSDISCAQVASGQVACAASGFGNTYGREFIERFHLGGVDKAGRRDQFDAELRNHRH